LDLFCLTYSGESFGPVFVLIFQNIENELFWLLVAVEKILCFFCCLIYNFYIFAPLIFELERFTIDRKLKENKQSIKRLEK
jgi:hypothetical protein